MNNSDEWNSDQEEQMGKFRQGFHELSQCNYSGEGSFNNEKNSNNSN